MKTVEQTDEQSDIERKKRRKKEEGKKKRNGKNKRKLAVGTKFK